MIDYIYYVLVAVLIAVLLREKLSDSMKSDLMPVFVAATLLFSQLYAAVWRDNQALQDEVASLINEAAVTQTLHEQALEDATAPVTYLIPNYVREEDVLYLAATMWGEARNQGTDGMRLVGETILNRAALSNTERHGLGLVGVILHARQFSVWNSNDPNRRQMLRLMASPENEDTEWQEALTLARELLTSDYEPNGILYYHTTDVAPLWSRGIEPVFQEGDHLFYEDVDG